MHPCGWIQIGGNHLRNTKTGVGNHCLSAIKDGPNSGPSRIRSNDTSTHVMACTDSYEYCTVAPRPALRVLYCTVPVGAAVGPLARPWNTVDHSCRPGVVGSSPSDRRQHTVPYDRIIISGRLLVTTVRVLLLKRELVREWLLSARKQVNIECPREHCRAESGKGRQPHDLLIGEESCRT